MKVEVLLVGHLWKRPLIILINITLNCLQLQMPKRGDIGNTSKMYAKAFFENLNFDSITLSPYMGMDTVWSLWIMTKNIR